MEILTSAYLTPPTTCPYYSTSTLPYFSFLFFFLQLASVHKTETVYNHINTECINCHVLPAQSFSGFNQSSLNFFKASSLK